MDKEYQNKHLCYKTPFYEFVKLASRTRNIRNNVLNVVKLLNLFWIWGSLIRGSSIRRSLIRGSLIQGSLIQCFCYRGSLTRGFRFRGSLIWGSLIRGFRFRGSHNWGSLIRGSLIRGSLTRDSLILVSHILGISLGTDILYYEWTVIFVRYKLVCCNRFWHCIYTTGNVRRSS